MKGLVKISFIVIALFLGSCQKDCDSCCYRISKSNIEGTWSVKNYALNGENQELGNATFDFQKDGNYQNNSVSGSWEFGETNNVLLITTENENYQLDVLEFSETEMLMSKTSEAKYEEFALIKQ